MYVHNLYFQYFQFYSPSYKEDDEGHRCLNLAVYNAVMGLGQALNNKMVANKSK